MNRQTILARVHHHLRDQFAEWGEERPLGEIVPLVARDIRSGSTVTRPTEAPVIPIERVSAFVDGRLETAEEDLICHAVMFDNSVLAEIIAAVRTSQADVESLPPLNPSLHAKLMSMAAGLPESQRDESQRGESERGESERVVPEAVQATPAADPIVVVPPPLVVSSPTPVKPSPVQPSPVKRSSRPMWISVVAVAASLLIAVVWWSTSGRDQGAIDSDRIAENAVRVDEIPPQPDVVPAPGPETDSVVDPAPPMVAVQKDPKTDPVPRPEPEPSEINQKPPTAVAIVEPETDPSTPNMPIPPDIDPMRDRDPTPVQLASKPRLTDLRWTEVTGLMAQAEADEEEDSRPSIKWSRVQGGSQSTSQSPSTVRQRGFALRTLPMSRAKGELGNGGRIVIAPDTGLKMMPSVQENAAEVDLMFGAVALLDVADGTTIRVRHGRRLLATLRWNSEASAVLQRLATGLQIQVEDGEVSINDTPVRSKSVRVADDQSVETVRAPRRLPRWITAPDDTSAEDRMILAQIAETGDLHTTLQQRIMTLARNDKLTRDQSQSLAKLAHWQAALAGPHVFRLAGSRVAAVRLAALNRMAQLPESDPRYEATWRTIERTVNNQQRVAQTRAWFRLLRTGARPNRQQLDEMLTGLAARDYAGRAMSDFMLRRYVANPPPFDPSWTGQTLQRAVAVYRQRAGVDRVRPNAAATTP